MTLAAETPVGFTMTFESVQTYVGSWMWENSRKRFQRHGGQMVCWLCGSDLNIELHHRSYRHVGSERPDELVALCDVHHGMVERLVRGRWASRWEAHMVLRERLARRAGGCPHRLFGGEQ